MHEREGGSAPHPARWNDASAKDIYISHTPTLGTLSQKYLGSLYHIPHVTLGCEQHNMRSGEAILFQLFSKPEKICYNHSEGVPKKRTAAPKME